MCNLPAVLKRVTIGVFMSRVESGDEFEVVLEAIAVGVVRVVMVRPLDIVAVEVASVGAGGSLCMSESVANDVPTGEVPLLEVGAVL